MKGMAVALLVAVSAAAFAAPKKIGGVQNENGDVKITLTRFIQNKVNAFMDLENGDMYNPRLISPSPDTAIIGTVKITATMTIKNASDAELGDKMPEFAIDDIRQEEI